MADAAIEILLNNLKELLVDHADLIKDTRYNIEILERDLGVLSAFLKNTVKKRKKNDYIKHIAMEVHDVVYEVEDIIDAFVTDAFVKRPQSSFTRFWKKSLDLHPLLRKVEEIKQKVQIAREEDMVGVDDEENDEKPEARPPRMRNVVGFEDVTEDLICRLTQETDYFDIISLIGMLGLGKTTLAWKIYNHPDIVYNFPLRIWLPISQQFSVKDILLLILKQVTHIYDDILGKDNHELADLVAAHLESGTFLIVMDDVWTTADWDKLRMALPHHNTKGKVLITSRNETVGRYASMPRPLYNLRLFTFEESWEMFRLEALGKLECPSELEFVGQRIAKSCDGLPLAIVVIGGILATRYSDSDTFAMKRYWEKVSKQVSSFLTETDPANRMKRSIYLSYDTLPYHLRPCFLYFGLFPENYEIPVWKLICMWIGEGFVQQNNDCSLEETAEMYLEELINRNLVKIEKFKADGKVKTCRVQDILHDFCLIEAANQNFLQEIKCQIDGQFAPSISNMDKFRRLSVHSNCLNFITSKPFGPRVRSFVCFSNDEYVLSRENCTKVTGAFKLLRVLDVLPLKFTMIASDLYSLIHLRYIALSFELPILPSKFNQLWNIRTLIVHTTSRTLEVKVDIWKMNQLRHFKTNASATLPKPTKGGKQSAKLQTLGLISAESMTEELSDRAPKLKKLGIRGKLALLFEGTIGSVGSLGKIRELGKLKLINDVYPMPTKEGRLRCLPQPHHFPPGLTSLTLCATFLSWEHMSTLGMLKELEVLKIKDNAFTGSIWEAVDGGFQRLELLLIENTDLVAWNASSHHYPRLRSLMLRNCEKLRGIPTKLADIPSLQKLELYRCISAAKSARDILDAKLAEGSAFKLSIFPPIE